ncbi:MAG: hypothetical protein K2P14_03580 [Anaeroplasmataceae bacterium]|nr:hypothetical protein [Anaeroplasmataceae bacterium]
MNIGNKLPDEIEINGSEGITLKIVDPEKYGTYYLELTAFVFVGEYKLHPDFDYKY